MNQLVKILPRQKYLCKSGGGRGSQREQFANQLEIKIFYLVLVFEEADDADPADDADAAGAAEDS